MPQKQRKQQRRPSMEGLQCRLFRGSSKQDATAEADAKTLEGENGSEKINRRLGSKDCGRSVRLPRKGMRSNRVHRPYHRSHRTSSPDLTDCRCAWGDHAAFYHNTMVVHLGASSILEL